VRVDRIHADALAETVPSENPCVTIFLGFAE
jgi:hypothetical protein